MAALTADVDFKTASGQPLHAIPMAAAAAVTHFRGAIVFDSATGIDLSPADAATVCGVVAEHTVVVTIGDPVIVYWIGLFLFANAAATLANARADFTMPNASDNPGDMVLTTGVGFSATAAKLLEPKTAGTDGWFFINAGDRIV